jgi:rRNA maturation RNase YbeY
VAVEITRYGAARRFSPVELRRIAETLLALLKLEQAELSIALVGDREMRPLNAKYRKQNKTTDVLSFTVDAPPKGPPLLLGDVVISVERARSQAKARKHTLKREMATLLIHGVLHLLGYDHERSQRQAKKMFALERKLQDCLCERGLLKL